MLPRGNHNVKFYLPFVTQNLHMAIPASTGPAFKGFVIMSLILKSEKKPQADDSGKVDSPHNRGPFNPSVIGWIKITTARHRKGGS
jgi:hypothetical protein